MSASYLLGAGAPRELLGGKAGALSALAASDLPIPAWFAVSPTAFEASLGSKQRAALAACAPAEAAAELAALSPAADVASAIASAVGELGGRWFAVRSSAASEDSGEASFAGQLESYLFVAPDDVAARVADVWRSGFAERVFAYRAEQGIAGPPEPPTVLVQLMVDADAAGVAFGADPVSGRRDVAVVSAVLGLGSALVSGDADADTWRVAADGTILERAIADKRVAHRADPSALEGVSERPVAPERAQAPALTDSQVAQVAALVQRASEHFGRPQDIEWAFEDGRLFLLQSRPITTLPADAGHELNIWDNSNIAESYGGVTTPLTFSFAREAYAEVYRELCRILGVSETAIEANSLTFERMLGLIHGRVYYNLLSWYRILALLPGYQANRRFMEQMMGVREPLPEELVAEQRPASGGAKAVDALRLARTMAGLLGAHFGLPARIERFNARLAEALAPRLLDTMRADELAAYYHELERRLLKHWDAPLVNDFYAMVFFGLLTSLCRRWIDPETRTLQNDLLTAEGGMISAEPARRVREMAALAADEPALLDALSTAEGAPLAAAIAAAPPFAAAYAEYLERFSDRCAEELKLESPTLDDDPLPLVRSVASLGRQMRDGRARAAADEGAARREAESRVRSALAGHPLRRAVFGWVLRHARARVRDRENLRFERTRVFGRVRRIALAIGRELTAFGALDDARDVFYLETAEMLGYCDGTASTHDLRGVAAERRALFDAYRAEPDPPARFETRGAVNAASLAAAIAPSAPSVEGDSLGGIGCCPGVVRGRARVIRDPRNDVLEQGEILIAERTDPGWVMLFPSASGILVERGSLLSHSAIVAREMGIPAVVSLPGLLGWLETGDLVEFDGTTGVVTRLEAADGSGDADADAEEADRGE